MKFIGVYDYTVILTYTSLFCTVLGICAADRNRFTAAVLCLMAAGLCDAFDGAVARSKKDRTEDEKAFGIQIDSLCDAISFGVFPAFLCFCLLPGNWLSLLCVFFYILCAVIRLGIFNVLEEKRQQVENGSGKFYRGLPVTTAAILFPVAYLFNSLLGQKLFPVLLYVYLLGMGLAFIADVRVRKPQWNKLLCHK